MSWRVLGVMLLVSTFILTGAGLGSSLSPTGVSANHPENACSDPYHVSWAGWDFCWQQEDVRVQGIEINRAFFHGESVIWKMGAPFTLTKYEGNPTGPFKDTFGTPSWGQGYGRGAMELKEEQCPRFYDGQSDLLHNKRICLEKRGGPSPEVTIWARFDVYNYIFIQGWSFDASGHITPFVALGGQLIDGSNAGATGVNHHHHLYWRVDFDIGEPGDDTFQQYQRLVGERQHAHTQAVENLAGGLACDLKGPMSFSGWCDLPREALMVREPHVHHKWRVANTMDTNAHGNEKSYEFTVHQSDHPPYTFSTFDVMVLQWQGDSQEIGYEVPQNPPTELGDRALHGYMTPPEAINDPVAWIVLHVYHDTRDEERGSMSYHWVDFDIRPNNFMDSNPGENSFV